MRYDLHVHSCYSICSNNQLKDILLTAKKKHLDGMALTDHNKIAGAMKLASLNRDKDFEVIIGEEVQSEYGHILGLYLNKELKARTVSGILDEIHSQGGIAIFAHPFDIFRHPFPRDVMSKYKDAAVETFNARMLFPWQNFLADKAARSLRSAKTGGSDAHFSYEIGQAYTCFEGDLKKAIKKKSTTAQGSCILAPIGIANTFLHKRLGIL